MDWGRNKILRSSISWVYSSLLCTCVKYVIFPDNWCPYKNTNVQECLSIFKDINSTDKEKIRRNSFKNRHFMCIKNTSAPTQSIYSFVCVHSAKVMIFSNELCKNKSVLDLSMFSFSHQVPVAHSAKASRLREDTFGFESTHSRFQYLKKFKRPFQNLIL